MLSRHDRDECDRAKTCEMTSARGCDRNPRPSSRDGISPHKHDTFVRTTFGHQLTSASLLPPSNTL